MKIILISIQNSFAVRRALVEERGATAVEYGLMVGLISVAIIGAVTYFSKNLGTSFNRYGNAVSQAGTGS